MQKRYAERANGFCYINNIAVSARYLQNHYDVNKLAIIDFDVHHGNGTQEIFYEDQTETFIIRRWFCIPIQSETFFVQK